MADHRFDRRDFLLDLQPAHKGDDRLFRFLQDFVKDLQFLDL